MSDVAELPRAEIVPVVKGRVVYHRDVIQGTAEWMKLRTGAESGWGRWGQDEISSA